MPGRLSRSPAMITLPPSNANQPENIGVRIRVRLNPRPRFGCWGFSIWLPTLISHEKLRGSSLIFLQRHEEKALVLGLSIRAKIWFSA